MFRPLTMVALLLAGSAAALATPPGPADGPTAPPLGVFVESPVVFPGGTAGFTHPPLLGAALASGMAETTWRQTVGRDGHGRLHPGAAIADGTGIVVVGSTRTPTGFVHKVDGAGDFVYRHHTAGPAALYDVALASDGGSVVGGALVVGSDVVGLVQKLAPDGSVLWTTHVPSATGLHGIGSLHVQPDGTILAHGETGQFPMLSVLGPDGALLRVQEFREVFTTQFVRGVPLPDGGHFIQTGKQLVDLDRDGQVRNRIIVPSPPGEAYVLDAALGSDGHLYLSGSTWEYPTPIAWDQHRAFLMKMTPSLDVVWASYISAADRTAGGTLALAADGDIVVVGKAAWELEYLPSSELDAHRVGQMVARFDPHGVARFVRVIVDEADPTSYVAASLDADPYGYVTASAVALVGDDIVAAGTRGPSHTSDMYLTRSLGHSTLGPASGPPNTLVNAVHTAAAQALRSMG